MEGNPTITYDLADRQNDCWGGGGSFFWIFALLVLAMGGNGGFFGGQGRTATVEDMNNSTNFARLESQVRANADLTERKIDGIANGISSLGYEVAQQFGNANTRMATGFCDMSKQLLENRYLDAQNASAIQSAIASDGEKTRALITQNKIEALQGRINQLELNQAVCGVVRYPQQATYNAGSPFGCFCCNGGTNI